MEDNAWEMTVATAAPATPRGVYRINTISRITLVTDEMTRNKKALRESPMARSAAAR